MNDLMTKSFLSYVDLKKQAQIDSLSEADLEKGQTLNPIDEENLSRFHREAEAVRSEIEEITNLLSNLRSLNEEAKSSHSAKILRGLRDRSDSDVTSILRRVRSVKAKLEALDRSNAKSRRAHGKRTPADRARVTIAGALRSKLKETVEDFGALRHKVVADHREDLRRKYYCNTGEMPGEELVEKMVSGAVRVEMFEGKSEDALGNKARHETAIDLQRSLERLHQVFLDMAVLVEAQGETIDGIEENVVRAGEFISGGTHSLYYANQAKRRTSKWVYWVWAVAVIILLVCLISMLAS